MMPPKKENEQPRRESAPASQEAIELKDRDPKDEVKDKPMDEPKHESKEEVVIKSPRHSIDQDVHYATEAVSRHAAHTLDNDAMIPVDNNRVRFKEHLLDEDEATPKKTPSTPHDLESDPAHESSSKTASKHDLTADETTKGAAPATPHELGNKSTE